MKDSLLFSKHGPTEAIGSSRSRELKLAPEQQFRLLDKVTVQRTTKDGEQIFFEDGNLEFSQSTYMPGYAYIRQRGESNALVSFKMTQDNIVETIFINTSLETLAVILEGVEGMPLQDELRQLFGLPEVTPALRARVGRVLNEQKRLRARIAELSPDLPKKRDTMQERDDAIRVLQNEAGITRADRPNSYIATFGAGPCVIVTLYDGQTKTGALAHFGDQADVAESIRRIVSRMAAVGANASQITAAVIGGEKGQSEKLVLGILDALEEQNIPITDKEVLNTSRPRAIILDTATGQLYNYIPRGKHFQSLPEDDLKILRAQIPGNFTILEDPNGL